MSVYCVPFMSTQLVPSCVHGYVSLLCPLHVITITSILRTWQFQSSVSPSYQYDQFHPAYMTMPVYCVPFMSSQLVPSCVHGFAGLLCPLHVDTISSILRTWLCQSTVSPSCHHNWFLPAYMAMPVYRVPFMSTQLVPSCVHGYVSLLCPLHVFTISSFLCTWLWHALLCQSTVFPSCRHDYFYAACMAMPVYCAPFMSSQLVPSWVHGYASPLCTLHVVTIIFMLHSWLCQSTVSPSCHHD